MTKIQRALYKPFLALMIVVSSIGFTACSEDNNPLNNINIFSAEDDVALGQQLDQEIKANPQQYPLGGTDAQRQYLQGIVNEILNSPLVKYKGTFTYTVQIINDPNTVNAFAAPGGYLYVYTGLIKFLDNEASLAAVLGHEIAHAERRHATQRMTKEYGASVLLGLVLGDNPSQWEQIASQLATSLAFLKNSRSDETEADEYGFQYLLSTRWYPGAGKFFFQKVMEQSGGSGGSILEELLSTHPLDQDRINDIDKMIKEHNLAAPTEANLFTQSYQQFKATF